MESTPEIGQNNMPLHCMICTRKPNFSDISHLLTHISSKQHLSNYFKTKVKAISDAAAKESLENFDEWYEAWDIDNLLRERMQQKEKKKKPTHVRSAGTVTKTLQTISRPAARDNVETRIQEDVAEEVSRQQAYAPTIKIESVARPSFMETVLPFEQTFISPLHATKHGSNNLQPYYMKSEFEDRAELDGDGFHSPSRPASRSTLSRNHATESVLGTASSSIRSSAYRDELKDEDIKEVKLKGVVWPGMDIFDSATPEMQRRRNQKKTVDVVHQLAAASIKITPDEVIFDRNGFFRLQQREINGNTENGTHLTGETTPEPDSPPKKGKARAKAQRKAQPLAELDVNRPVKRRYVRRNKKNIDQAAQARSRIDTDELDNPIAHGAAKKRKRAGFSIHRDNTGPEITFDHPASMNYLTSGFGHTYNHRGDVVRPHSARQDGVRVDSGASFLLEQHVQRDLKPEFEDPEFEDLDDTTDRTAFTRRDLSAFGQLTNIYNPGNSFGMFSLHNTGFVSQSQMPHATQFHLHNDHNQSVRALDQTYRTWQAPGIHHDVAQAHCAIDFTIGNFEPRQHSHNPLFFGSDHIFEDEESIERDDTMKKEIDHESSAETISLASDQK